MLEMAGSEHTEQTEFVAEHSDLEQTREKSSWEILTWDASAVRKALMMEEEQKETVKPDPKSSMFEYGRIGDR